MPTWVPLGLSFIAANLRQKGHDVAIFDRFAWQAKTRNDKGLVNQAMLQQIEAFQPDLIGLNTITPLIYDCVECVDLIRNNYRGLIVAGGHHATALPELTLQKIPGLDYVVAGEGEEAMARLAAGDNPASIPGLWIRGKDGVICGNLPEQVRDLDRLPLPALDLLDMPFYTKPSTGGIRGYRLSTLSVLASRGCTKRCDFCSESLTYGRGVRFHSPEYVAAWAEQLIAEYRVNGLYFHDNNFLQNHAWAETVCEQLLKVTGGRVKWAIQARADSIDERSLRLLKRAGCVRVEIGVETPVQEQLDYVDKGTTVAMNERAIALCRKVGLYVHAYMIISFADESLEDLVHKLDWLKRIKPTTFSWSILNIYPGTALYLKEGNDFFARNDWTEDKIKSFFQEGLPGGIGFEERKKWMRRNYYPYQRKQYYRLLLRANSPWQLSLHLWEKMKNMFIAG